MEHLDRDKLKMKGKWDLYKRMLSVTCGERKRYILRSAWCMSSTSQELQA